MEASSAGRPYLDRGRKVNVITAGVALTVAVFSIREQLPVPTVASLAVLLLFVLTRKSTANLIGLGGSLVYLHPGPNSGWLYGRDSPKALYGTVRILENGWPVSDASSLLAFTETPLLHVHAIMVHLVTDLPLTPGVEARLLTPVLLPLVYTSTTLAVAYKIADRHLTPLDVDVAIPVAFLPVVLWIPLTKFHSGFRRESIGILLFTVAAFFLVRSLQVSNRRGRALLFLFVLGCILAHHFSSLMLILLVGTVTAILFVDRLRSTGTRASGSFSFFVGVMLFSVIVFAGWQIVGEFGGQFTIALVASLFVMPDNLAQLLQPSFSDASFPHEIGISTYGILRSFVGMWVYQGLIAVGLLLALLDRRRNPRRSRTWTISMVLFGAVTAVFSMGGWVTGFVDFTRVMCFFVVAAAWIAPVGLHERLGRGREGGSIPALVLFTVLLVIIAAGAVPLHVISDEQPKVIHGERDQRYSQSDYAVANFVDEFVSATQIIGDDSVSGVVATREDQPVVSRHSIVLSGRVPPDSAVVLTSRNERLYEGYNYRRGERISVDPVRLHESYGAKNDKIYGSGTRMVYA